MTIVLVLLTAGPAGLDAQVRPRARDIGIAPGTFPTGANNAITDVAGVRVGQTTVVRRRQRPHRRHGHRRRTAAISFAKKCRRAVFVGNAFGKLAGSTQVEELGTIESPIVLTNTLSVGHGGRSGGRWTLDQPGNETFDPSIRSSAKPTTAA